MPRQTSFGGFRDAEGETAIPDAVIVELLPQIEDFGEFKVILYAMWRFQHMDSAVKALSRSDFPEKELGLDTETIRNGLSRAVRDQVLVRAGEGDGALYLPNSPSGRAAAMAIEEGGTTGVPAVSQIPIERGNVFKLYEENIGPLTPLIADALKDAEGEYPGEWIAEAIELAVRNNKRSWSYCEAILRRWKEEGRGTQQNRRDDQAARQRDVEEKIRRFIRG